MINYDHAIAQLTAHGLILDRPVDTKSNKIQRWRVDGEDRERRGWSRLREWMSAGGRVFLVGAYGVWHGTDNGYTEIELPPRDDQAIAVDAEERAAFAAAQKASQRAMRQARKAEIARASRWAQSVWSHAVAARDHEYLTDKGIGPHGVRVLESLEGIDLPGVDTWNRDRLQGAIGALVIPMHQASGDLSGLQFIYDRAHPRRQKSGRNKEFWPKGMAMGSSFGVLGPIRRTGILLLTEGYATAASLHEATGQSVAYAFSANNLDKAVTELKRKYTALRILIAADDDYLTDGNPGTRYAAETCAKHEQVEWVAPDFTDAAGNDMRDGRKLTDFNDLAQLAGSLPLAVQVNARLDALGWRDVGAGAVNQGGGENGDAMASLLTVDEAVARYWGTYGLGGKVFFDEVERDPVHRDDVLNLLPQRSWEEVKKHPGWRVARRREIGFDPTEADPEIRCNLFAGWPTTPVAGECGELLGLLEYMCTGEANSGDLYQWVLRWLAYPLQHRGAKMHSALIIHGWQGTGKSRFFEAYAQIFGPYGRVLGQEALEDKFNADWAEKKLFILADEVLARGDMYHIKNRLKGFITGGTIRVNPKNVAAHEEKNQMNIAFLSNERMPAVLENDDRRHCVIWVPPKLPESYFAKVNAEIDAGGVAALHHFLLNLDLGDFRPWTPPPMTDAKADLIQLGRSSEERFMHEWRALEIEGPDGDVLPFCPCLGSSLYQAYAQWCERHGERKHGAKDLISLMGKQPNWTAGTVQKTHETLAADAAGTYKSRKMVVPDPVAIDQAYAHAPPDERTAVLIGKDETKAKWLTRCFFLFERRVGNLH